MKTHTAISSRTGHVFKRFLLAAGILLFLQSGIWGQTTKTEASPQEKPKTTKTAVDPDSAANKTKSIGTKTEKTNPVAKTDSTKKDTTQKKVTKPKQSLAQKFGGVKPKKKKEEPKEPEVEPDTTLKVYNIVTDSQYTYYIDINLNALIDGVPMDSIAVADSVYYLEVIRGDTDTVVVHDVIPYPFGTVLIMLDISGSMKSSTMKDQKLSNYEYAKNIIGDLIRKHKLPAYTTYFSVFNEQPTDPIPINSEKWTDLDVYKPRGYTHLYHSLYQNVEWLEGRPGRKIMILLADGEDDPRGKPAPKYGKQDLMTKFSELGSDFHLFPIGIGDEIHDSTMKELVDSTVNSADTFSFNKTPKELETLLDNVTQVPWTHTVQFNSKNPPYTANWREILAVSGSKQSSDQYRLGAIFNPWKERTIWRATWLTAFILIGLVAIFFALVNPWLRQRNFNQKFVKHYWEVKVDGQNKYDPLTKYPFQDNDLVVVKCEHMTSLETWNYEQRKEGKDKGARIKKKNRCIYYPHECKEGVGPNSIGDFLSQKGMDKPLFWLVAGALGAFLGWAGFAILDTNREGDYGDFLHKMAGTFEVQNYFDMPNPETPGIFDPQIVYERFLEPLSDHIWLGALFAFGVCLTLGFAKELNMGRVRLGWTKTPIFILRMLFYLVTGTLAGIVVFGGMELLHLNVFLENSWLPGILSLLITGFIIGIILTGQVFRGGLGGAVAGLLVFLVFFIPTHYVFTLDAEGWKMLMFVLFGGCLGLVLSTASTKLELAEVEAFTRGKRFQKTNITDWLRANGSVTIGRGPSANIRLKGVAIMKDGKKVSLTDTYARFILKNENIFIEPLVETTVNGMLVLPNSRRKLKDRDEIQFKGKSPATIIFKQIKAGSTLF